MENKKLIKIEDLYDGGDIQIQQNKLAILLNHPPKQEWLKNHPTARNVVYIPIQRIEWLLTAIFINWHVEIKETKLIANSVSVTIRLHYQSVIDGSWQWQDGIGASPLQTDKGANATDWTQIKSNAVMIAAPAAESYAVKDAAEKIGKIFGKDMNRSDQIMYDSLDKKFEDKEADIIQTKVIEALEAMDECEEKATFQKMCSEKLQDGKFTVEFGNRILKEILK